MEKYMTEDQVLNEDARIAQACFQVFPVAKMNVG